MMLFIIGWALAVNVTLYQAKLIAVRRYQELLLHLYEKPDLDTFFLNAVPLLQKRVNPTDRITHAVHVANACLMRGT